MIPSEKSSKMEQFLESWAGRSTAIKKDRCVSPPFGCGKEIGRFKDTLSVREYRISGLCQNCQDQVFEEVE
jgi:hypothetical protein